MASRVVYTQAPIQLGRVIARESPTTFRVTVGARESVIAVDPSVDPELVEDARVQGARVLIDAQGEPVIVGAVLTARPVVIDREGDIRATARRIVLSASREVLAKTAAAFVHVKDDEAEVYGTRVITRAREVAKILARMISLN